MSLTFNGWLTPVVLSTFPMTTTIRSYADADKPARRVQRSVKVIKHSTISYVMHSLLLV